MDTKSEARLDSLQVELNAFDGTSDEKSLANYIFKQTRNNQRGYISNI